MKRRVPFFLGLILGPVGVIVARIMYGSDANGDSLRGLGAFVCVLLFCRIVASEISRSHAKGSVEVVNPHSQRPQTHEPEDVDEMRNSRSTTKIVPPKVRVVASQKKVDSSVVNAQPVANAQPKDALDEARAQETREKMAHLKELILKFSVANNGRLPPLLSYLSQVRGKKDRIPCRDAWGRRFSYESLNGDFAIVSAGPDRQFDTDDDMELIVRKND